MLKILLLIILSVTTSYAIIIDNPLEDKSLEKRAQILFKNVKCMTCAGQSIAESDSGISRDLRNFIRQELLNDKSDREIEIYLAKKFGDSIILTPKNNSTNYLLWFFPIIFISMISFSIHKNKVFKIKI